MPDKQADKWSRSDDTKLKKKKRCKKYLTQKFGFLILLILIIAAIAHFWFIPAKVSGQIERALSKFWDGKVDIEDIDIYYRRPIYLTRVNFSDKTGRKFMYADKVNLVLENWPSPHPIVTEIHIEKLNLQLSTADGKFTTPVKNPYRRPRGKKKKVDIHEFSINNIEVTFIDAKNTNYVYDNMQFLANKTGNAYNFSLNKNSDDPVESLLATGNIDLKTLQTNSSLQIKHFVHKPEMALAFTKLNIPNLSAAGGLEANLKITGCLKQPAELKPQGFISFDEWTVNANGKTITSDLTAKADIKDGHFNFENITATVCDGDVNSSFYVDMTTEFSGYVFAQNINFEELTSVFGSERKKETKGTVTFDYAFSGRLAGEPNLIGEGQFFMDEADISAIPILPYIFETIGLQKLTQPKVSDVECTFKTAGPVVTIQTANVANRFAAVRAEPGGTINLKTKHVDMYVKAVLIKQIDAVIKNTPVINIFSNIKDRLTRLHIKGKWSDPPTAIIKKEPIVDIKDATVGFFKDIVESGGQITRKISRRLGDSTDSEAPRSPD